MQEFGVKNVELKENMSKVVLKHFLWGAQTFRCKHLKIIDDDYRKGVIIKGQEIFVYKKDIIKETSNQVSDGKLTITIYE